MMVCNIYYDKPSNNEVFVVYTKENYSFEYDEQTGQINKKVHTADSNNSENQSQKMLLKKGYRNALR